ncbi:uncharacterized protein [Amphiura filiformis]|uniref:uncharacterized protein n=1 Tax=Amphiura filiformis TaxID=82378 RepID=UPI003B20D863
MHRFPDQHFPSSVCPRLEAVHPLDTCGDLTAVKTESKPDDQAYVFRCQYENQSTSGLTFSSVEPAVPLYCTKKKTKKKKQETGKKILKYSEKTFYGGCLSYQTYPSGECTGILFHPRMSDLKGLSVVPVTSQLPEEGGKQTCMFNTQHPYMDYPLSEHLVQIETTHSTDKGSIITALRTHTECHLVNITGENGKLKFCKSHIIPCKHRPTSISLSPYIKRECLISYADGSIQLRDIDKHVQHVTPEWEDMGQACWSHFGSHPRLILAHGAKQLDLFDIRSSLSSARICLMMLPNDLLARDQEIQVTKQHPMNYFYHLVATQDMMVLLDERFPKYNVLQWPHHLQSSPYCINVVNQALPAEDLAIVSSHRSAQSHCLQFSCLDGSTPMSTAPIWKLSSISCWLDAMSQVPTCHGVDDVKKQLDRSLIGTCTAEHTDGKRLTVFQVSDIGDVFQQTLSPSPDEDNKDKTAIPGPGFSHIKLSEESEKICKKWMNEALLNKRKNKSRKRYQWSEKTSRSKTIKELQLIEPHPDCDICTKKPQDKRYSPKTPRLRDNITCPACGILLNSSQLTDYLKTTRTSTTLNNEIITSRVVPSRQSREELPWKPLKYSQYSDAIGCLLKKHWQFDGDDDEEDVNGDDDDEQFGDINDQASSQKTQTPMVPTSSAGSQDSLSKVVQSANPSVSLSSLKFPEQLSAGIPKVSLTRFKNLPESSTTMSSPRVPQKRTNFLEASQQLSQSSIVSTPRSPQKRITARRKLLNPKYTMGF